MLTQFTARTANVKTKETIHQLVFSMGSSEYVIKDIAGLGPVKAPITTIDVAADPGGQYMSSQDGMRNIVLSVGFEPDYSIGSTVEDLRHELYKVFMPKSRVEMEFVTDKLGAMWIEGWVETHEPSIFNEDPGVQISIICPYPYFRSAVPAPIQFPVPQGSASFVVPFEGLIPVGFKFMFNVTTPRNGVWLHAESAPKDFYLAMPTFSFQTNDWVEFSTVKDDRWVKYIRSFADTDALGEFRGSLVDAKLHPGGNHFYLPELASLSDVTFEYNIVYGGL